MDKYLISMLRGMGLLPQIQPTRYTGELVQSNPQAPMQLKDVVPSQNWMEDWMLENQSVPQAHLGTRG